MQRRNSSRHREAIEARYGKPVAVLIDEWRGGPTARQRMTFDDIARAWDVSEGTVRRWRREGTSPTTFPQPPDDPARAPVPLERAALSLVTQRAAAESAPSQEAESVA